MKTTSQIYLFLHCLFLLGNSNAFGQTNPHFDMDGGEICISNNGPNDRCEAVEDQIVLLDFDTEEGYRLIGLKFPYPIELSLESVSSFVQFREGGIRNMLAEERHLKIEFETGESIDLDMEETGQVGFYMEGDRMAILLDCGAGFSLREYLEESNSCESIAVWKNERNKATVETGIGTILVIDELIDETGLPPMDDMAKGATIGLGDAWGTVPIGSMTYEAGRSLLDRESFQLAQELACMEEHRSATDQSCLIRVSMLSEIYICGDYIVVKDPLQSWPYYFRYSLITKVFIYKDHAKSELVIWNYGPCSRL